VTIKNILGHVSLQTTQIYAEISQNTVDQKLREWNETWFGENKKIEMEKSVDVPDFLRKR
ncbi:MAG: recombinase XerD, partial [Dorea sp.]|nr:recombinase XerD [Dorea sp.]